MQRTVDITIQNNNVNQYDALFELLNYYRLQLFVTVVSINHHSIELRFNLWNKSEYDLNKMFDKINDTLRKNRIN